VAWAAPCLVCYVPEMKLCVRQTDRGPSSRTPRHIVALAALLVACSSTVPKTEIGRSVVIGAGGAVEVELRKGTSHLGSNVFVEYSAIEDWLELELGLSVFPMYGGAEVSTDFLFKKPFRLADRLECMLGVGPELVRAIHSPDTGTFGGGETAADFMFWPSPHVGLWIEPSYDFVFRDGVSHGIGSTGGLIVGW
jgi:hypothetical protein